MLQAESFSLTEAQGRRLKKEARREFYRCFEQQEAPRHRQMLARMAQDFVEALRARSATASARHRGTAAR
jgi:hypothetical protein